MNRLGRSTADYNRLTKITFNTEFDARKFRASYDQARKENEDIKKFRIRSSNTKEYRDKMKEKAIIVYKWNKAAHDTKGVNTDISYSHRNDGSIWCFRKQTDGRWIRDNSWTFKEHLKTFKKDQKYNK